MTTIELACLDMAGTTVEDGGTVEAAFTKALEAQGLEPDSAEFETARQYVLDTMGMSKIVVFREVFGGDEDRARAANDGFEAAYAAAVADVGVRPIDGADDALDRLREAGVKVCLTTGFSKPTQHLLLDALGWHDRIDLALVPSDVGGRGRPYPDLVLVALMQLGVEDVRQVACAGDTANDALCGHRAGASIVAGVLTGAHDRAQLEAAPTTHVLESIVELPALIRSASGG